jgi:hypothetical protein
MSGKQYLKFLAVFVFICMQATAVNVIKKVETAENMKSAIIMLGDSGDFDRTGKVLLANRNVWGPSGYDRGNSYRKLMPNATADILFAASVFDVDENGLCRKDLVLEIFYRDDIAPWTNEKKEVNNRIIIKSRIDFAANNEYFETGHLQTVGDRKWKTDQIFFEHTPRQMVRAIDGSFHFQIINSSSQNSILISYIKLRTIDHDELVKLRDNLRAQRGLKRDEFEPGVSEKRMCNQSEREFVVYPVNYLELVFPKSPVECDRVDEELKCFEVPGEAEPVSFVIHSYKDVNNVHIVVNDLKADSYIISADNIDVRRVVFNDQRWGWMTDSRYGTCPDYLSFKNPEVDIPTNSNCQFWLTINVPETTIPGIYKGKVGIYVKGQEIHSIGLSVEVLPIKLLPNCVKHMIYHSPYLKKFHKEPVEVLRDMKKHRVVPIYYPPLEITNVLGTVDVRLDGFERQLRQFVEIYPEARELFVGFFNYYVVWHGLNGPKPEFATPFPQFEETYGRILRKYAELARRYKIELYFSFNDEPFKNIGERRVSYLCSLIAQKNGLKTWSTHNLDYDIQLPLTENEIRSNINYLRPLRDVLDVFAEIILKVDEAAIDTFKKNHSNLSYYTTYLATSVRPIYNRFVHGLYPFVTNSKFVLVYAYRDSVVDPYDDMDLAATFPYPTSTNDYLLTYPTWRGDILPTLSYEALREGVEDSQLISTMKVLIDKALKAGNPVVVKLGKEAEDYLNEILARPSKNFKQNYWRKHTSALQDPMEKAILTDLNAQHGQDYAIFDNIRREVCDRIISLQNALIE